jgi:dTDP-4-dehydrorhamnose 3,5-epimerase
MQKLAPMSETFESGDVHDVIVRPLNRYDDSRGWLTELFRSDELPPEFLPVMAYISSTHPGITRGPHEHVDQADLFCFIGPSNFKLRLWDNRSDSPTYGRVQTLVAGEDNPQVVVIPKGVVHAYQNIGNTAGIVINCPNRLYKGNARGSEVDEIGHEDDPDTIFKMGDL